jgi:hypothetical protein
MQKTKIFKGFCKIGFREHRLSIVAGAKEEKGKTKKKQV